MDIINSNRLRVSARTFRPGYGERFNAAHHGTYWSADHDKRRREWNYFAQACGIVVNVKWRPDGKRPAVSEVCDHG